MAEGLGVKSEQRNRNSLGLMESHVNIDTMRRCQPQRQWFGFGARCKHARNEHVKERVHLRQV